MTTAAGTVREVGAHRWEASLGHLVIGTYTSSLLASSALDLLRLKTSVDALGIRSIGGAGGGGASLRLLRPLQVGAPVPCALFRLPGMACRPRGLLQMNLRTHPSNCPRPLSLPAASGPSASAPSTNPASRPRCPAPSLANCPPRPPLCLYPHRNTLMHTR